MINTNNNDFSEEADLNELFSGINTHELAEPLDQYLASLSSFFSKYTFNTNTSLIRIYDDFESELFNADEAKFAKNSLQYANYDESALQREVVILFSNPVIVSELSCTNVPSAETEGAVRLISFSGNDKRFATKRTTKRDNAIRGTLVSTYNIHDVVLGLILPKRSLFHSVKIASIHKLNTEPEKLEKVKDALNQARELPLIEMQKIASKFDRINGLLDIQRDKFESISSDIKVLDKKKANAETSLSNSQSTLDKVRNDIDKSSLEYDKLSKSIYQQSELLSTIRAKIKVESDLCKKEESRHKSLVNDTEKSSDLLKAIQQELVEANRQKNLTTLDMVGHSNETSKQLRPYYVLVAVIFLALACMAKYIYQKGENLIDMMPFLVHVNSWDILLSRLPLITATTLIIGGLSGVFFLVKHIVALNTEKMTMLKAAILAEQITNSIECKGMTEQEQLEFKRDTKIKLITQVFSKNESEIDKTNFVMDVLKAVSDKK